MKQILLLLLTAAFAAAQIPFSIVIIPDDFPGDISWQLQLLITEAIVATGTDGVTGNIPPGEFIFTIFDAGEDGLCCANGRGSFTLRANNVDFFTSNGDFGASQTVVWTIDEEGRIELLDGIPTLPEPTGEFNIALIPAPGFDPSTQPVVVDALFAAAARWESVIIGDLPDVDGVDDLAIIYDFSPIDGPGSILGAAGPTWLRIGSLLPYTGVMNFDIADIGFLKEAELEALFLHQIGHVLGIGSLWELFGCSLCESTGEQLYDPIGLCPSATDVFSRTPNRAEGASLLIELDGPFVTRCGHWDEVQLQSEVMTGFLSLNPETGISELSTITIGALQDMGYAVRFDAADNFAIPMSELNSDILMDLSNDRINTMPQMGMTDIEQGLNMGDLNDMMAANGSASVTGGVVGGTLGAAAVLGAGGAFFVRRRRNQASKNKENQRRLMDHA